MALGDGIRRNIATVEPDERRRLRDAFIALNKRFYGGDPQDAQFGRFVPGGVSFWFKQDEIHARTGVHSSPAFLPWHRELCNRIEALIRSVDPELSLHYWDWTTDPTVQEAPDGQIFSLFTEDFMGSADGLIGEPWLSAGFYDPNAAQGRDTNPGDPDPHEDLAYNAALPPKEVTRTVSSGAPVGSDADIISAADYPAMWPLLRDNHDAAHGHIGGSIGFSHTSFRDPFVFLLHSNVDRLFALWQLQPGHPDRLDRTKVYGSDGSSVAVPKRPTITAPDGFLIGDNIRWGILSPLLPWSGWNEVDVSVNGLIEKHRIVPIRPWADPENCHLGNSKNSKDPSVVSPPKYDTNP
jgi:hypothetical protein